jgi:hypothetical protein
MENLWRQAQKKGMGSSCQTPTTLNECYDLFTISHAAKHRSMAMKPNCISVADSTCTFAAISPLTHKKYLEGKGIFHSDPSPLVPASENCQSRPESHNTLNNTPIQTAPSN